MHRMHALGHLGRAAAAIGRAAEALNAFEQAIAIAKRLGHVGTIGQIFDALIGASLDMEPSEVTATRMTEARTVMAQVASWGHGVLADICSSGTRGPIGSGTGSRDGGSRAPRASASGAESACPRMARAHASDSPGSANATTSALRRRDHRCGDGSLLHRASDLVGLASNRLRVIPERVRTAGTRGGVRSTLHTRDQAGAVPGAEPAARSRRTIAGRAG